MTKKYFDSKKPPLIVCFASLLTLPSSAEGDSGEFYIQLRVSSILVGIGGTTKTGSDQVNGEVDGGPYKQLIAMKNVYR